MNDIRDVPMSAVAVAPLGGGPSTPDLVIEAARNGALAFLAAAYKTGDQVQAEIEAVRAATAAPFGVNVFVPGLPTRDPHSLERYLDGLRREGYALGEPTWDDDDWDAKTARLLSAEPAVVTFTFGTPPRELVTALGERGCAVGVTVTSPEEAVLARDVGAGFVCAQGPGAGGHRGTFRTESAPDGRALPQLLLDVAEAVDLPVLAAGGIATRADVTRVQAQGAIGAICGTAFLRCPESGARQAYKDALADPAFTETVVTRAFSGRPARGLRNHFIDQHPDAPFAYPEINNATRALRASSGPEAMSLWAGTGWRHAEALPVADVLDRLLP